MAAWQSPARLLLFEDIRREQVRRGHSVSDWLLIFLICAQMRQVARGHRQQKHLINAGGSVFWSAATAGCMDT
jgi:hypothetical protein